MSLSVVKNVIYKIKSVLAAAPYLHLVNWDISKALNILFKKQP